MSLIFNKNPNRKVTNFPKAFAYNLSTDIKLSKT